MKCIRLVFIFLLMIALQVKAQRTVTVSVYFNSAQQIPISFKSVTDSISGWEAEYDISLVSITGFTDSIGSNSYNQKLSEARATSIETLISDLPVNRSNRQLKGMGEVKPHFQNKTAEGRAKNRRADIEFGVKKKCNKVLVIEQPSAERDTIIKLPGGTEITIKAGTLKGIRVQDIVVNATEYFNMETMIQNEMLTETTDGQCLSTGGMLKFRITDKNGQPVQLREGAEFTVSIPQLSNDTAYQLYERTSANEGWVRRTETVDYLPEQKRFQVSLNTPDLSMNLDFLPIPNKPLVKKDSYVKTRFVRNAKVYIYGETSLLKYQQVKPKKHKREACNCIPVDRQKIRVITKKKGKVYIADDFKRNFKKGLFNKEKIIIRKRDYKISEKG